MKIGIANFDHLWAYSLECKDSCIFIQLFIAVLERENGGLCNGGLLIVRSQLSDEISSVRTYENVHGPRYFWKGQIGSCDNFGAYRWETIDKILKTFFFKSRVISVSVDILFVTIYCESIMKDDILYSK